MSELTLTKAVTTTQPVKCFAGVVPFTMNLEVIYNKKNSDTGVGNSYALTVHLTGYGVQPIVVWRGDVVVEDPTLEDEIPAMFGILIPSSPISFSTLPFPIHIPISQQPIPDSYQQTAVSMHYHDYGANTITENHLGLAFVPNNNGDYDVMIVNTSIHLSLMIGARNIIITDPKVP